MPTISPVTELIAKIHPLGDEVDLFWQLPESLPAAFNVYVFRKETAYYTNANIAAYFADPAGSGITPQILTGFPAVPAPYAVADMTAENGKTYYYSIVIHDTLASYSAKTDVTAVVASSASADVPDTVSPIIDLIVKVLKNYGMTEKKDYEIHREYGLETNRPPTFYVMRASGSIMQRFIGRAIKPEQIAGEVGEHGQIDIDNIQVIWEDPSSVRRENIVKIFRESREAMHRYLVAEQGADFVYADIIIEGDVYNESVKDRVQVGGSMLIQCGIVVKSKYTEDLDSWYAGSGNVQN